MRDALLPMLVAMVSPALAGCPTVDLGETPPDPSTCNADFLYYETVIWPEYLAPPEQTQSCVGAVACHRIEDGRSALRLTTAEPIDHQANFTVVLRFVNCGSPDQSPLLTKPVTDVDPHGGGDLFPMTAPEVNTFLTWFP